jgi:hypothetical protein
MAGENLDLSSDGFPPPAAQPDGGLPHFLGIQFVCCGVYARIYRNRDRSAYEGYCPRCARPVRVGIGPGGSTSRFFTVY